MLSISHGLTGAFIASSLGDPVAATPLILASHYLQDWFPHWDVGTGLSSGKRKKSHAILMELIELSITIGLVYWGWQLGNTQIQWLIWYGVFVSLIPDFLEAPRNFLNWEPKIFALANQFHGWFHTSTFNLVWGLTPQVGLWIAILSTRV